MFVLPVGGVPAAPEAEGGTKHHEEKQKDADHRQNRHHDLLE